MLHKETIQRDVARALGLTQATVSLALRNDPRIPEAHRNEIQSAAREMGYHPNPTAAALAHFKWDSRIQPVNAALAWLNLWPQPKALRNLPGVERSWQGATAAAEELGYRLEEFAVNDRMPVARLETVLTARGISGIFLPPHPSQPDWGEFHWENFSAVRFGRSIGKPAVHVVAADHVANAMLAFHEIRRRGYPRVGMVTKLRHDLLFDAGFLKAQCFVEERQRLPILMVDGKNPWASLAALARWLKSKRPDAVFTDVAEVRAMLEKCGCRVPEDIGLAVTNAQGGKAEAGIDPHPEEVGRLGVLMLNSLINDNDRGVPPLHREILVKGKWVDGSTLPAR